MNTNTTTLGCIQNRAWTPVARKKKWCCVRDRTAPVPSPTRALTKRQFCRQIQIRQGMKTQQVRRQQKQQDTAADGRQARMHYPDQNDHVHDPIRPGQRGERNTVRWVKRHCAVHGGAGERELMRCLCTDVSQIDPCPFPRTFVADHVRVQNESSVFVAQHMFEKADDGGTCGCV
jgi:hypothetical protein